MRKVLIPALLASITLSSCGDRPQRPLKTNKETTTSGDKIDATMMTGLWESECIPGDVLGKNGMVQYTMAVNPSEPKVLQAKNHYVGAECAGRIDYVSSRTIGDYSVDASTGIIAMKGEVTTSVKLNSSVAVSRANAVALLERKDWKKGTVQTGKGTCADAPEVCKTQGGTIESIDAKKMVFTDENGVKMEFSRVQ